MSALLVVLGAALGAPLRYALAHALDGRWPTGTLLANVLGSALVGCCAALALSGRAWALVAIGFCGALTSFSSLAVQAVERGPRLGATYALASLALSLLAVSLGFAVGSAVG